MPDRDLPAFDCYGALGVPTSATTADIEAAFRAAAKREHPDLHADAALATLRMQRLNVARDWLVDPERRGRYDAARGVRRIGAAPVDLPEIDPLGAWPGPPDIERRGSMAGPTMASIALMVLITMLFVGAGSLLAAAIAVAAIVVLVFGVLLTVLGAFR